MKKQILKNSIFFSGLRLFKSIYEAGSMVELSNAKHLKLVLLTTGRIVIRACFRKTTLVKRVRLLNNFYQMIIKYNKNFGKNSTIKYLKYLQLSIQKAIAGQPFSSLRDIDPSIPLPRLSSSGLPTFISKKDRYLILHGSESVIRF